MTTAIDIPIYDGGAVNAAPSIREAVQRVLDSRWFVLGEEVRRFEAAFGAYCGASHCVSVANGTDALELGLRALGVGAGDRVLLAANAGFYGTTAVLQVGAVPVFADVDARTLVLSADAVDAGIRASRPRAVILTHLYGYMADAAAVAQVCAAHAVPLLEDCAQAHGARRDGRLAGSLGAVGCYSFYPTKNLGALGDGGALVCADAALADRLRSLRQYGWSRKYHNALPGGRNSRLDELQAAVLLAKLAHLDEHNAMRRAVARRYAAALADLPLQLQPSWGAEHVAHLFVVRTPRRDALAAHLRARGIGCDVHYPVPDHRQEACPAGSRAVQLPATEQACAEVLSLPCFPGLGEDAVDRVVSAVREFFA